VEHITVVVVIIVVQVHLRSAERLLKMCCKNGGCFIKVGQHVGSLDYLLPPEYVNTMKVLHDKAPETPLHKVHQVIREEFGAEVSVTPRRFHSKSSHFTRLVVTVKLSTFLLVTKVFYFIIKRLFEFHCDLDAICCMIMSRMYWCSCRIVTLGI